MGKILEYKTLKKKTTKTSRPSKTKKTTDKTTDRPPQEKPEKTVKKVVQKKGKTPEKIPRPSTSKKKAPAKEKVSAAAKKVAGKQRTVKEKAKTVKTTKPKTSSKKPAGKAVAKPPQEKPKKTVKKVVQKKGKISQKIFLPEEPAREEESQGVPSFKLPEKYGENEILLIAVEPNIIFASWEINKADIVNMQGILNLRAYDVTCIDFDCSKEHCSIDLKIERRVGNDFFNIKMHGRDILIEIGLLDASGQFNAIARSNTVSIPPLLVPDEFGIAQKFYESGIPVGY
jgi:hypothetical protein